MFIILHFLQSGKLLISQTYLILSVSFIIFLRNIYLSNINLILIANVFIKYINDTSAWVALKDESQAKPLNKILPKLQTIHKNIVLLPWSAYYNKQTSLKRKFEDSLSPPHKDNVELSITNNEYEAGQTPEKVPRLSKG